MFEQNDFDSFAPGRHEATPFSSGDQIDFRRDTSDNIRSLDDARATREQAAPSPAEIDARHVEIIRSITPLIPNLLRADYKARNWSQDEAA